jgi:hypothetical protein
MRRERERERESQESRERAKRVERAERGNRIDKFVLLSMISLKWLRSRIKSANFISCVLSTTFAKRSQSLKVAALVG